MWLFQHKHLAYDTLSCYKARVVVNGSTQLSGIDVDKSFSMVVKQATIRTVFSLATSQHWPIHQLDVKNAFVHDDIFLIASSKHKYATEILERARMVGCNPFQTHVDIESMLGTDGDPISYLTLYHSLAGALHYLTFTRPNVSYDVQQLYSSFSTSLAAYSDMDWACCPTTHKSTFGYCVFLGNNLLSWSSKRQLTLCQSSVEADRDVTNVIAETCSLRNLLCELNTPLSSATLVYFDNVNDFYLSSNPVHH
nr:ribonuclease H-like domain-containing protein [Tanacetum cinerariifolium]